MFSFSDFVKQSDSGSPIAEFHSGYCSLDTPKISLDDALDYSPPSTPMCFVPPSPFFVQPVEELFEEPVQTATEPVQELFKKPLATEPVDDKPVQTATEPVQELFKKPLVTKPVQEPLVKPVQIKKPEPLVKPVQIKKSSTLKTEPRVKKSPTLKTEPRVKKSPTLKTEPRVKESLKKPRVKPIKKPVKESPPLKTEPRVKPVQNLINRPVQVPNDKPDKKNKLSDNAKTLKTKKSKLSIETCPAKKAKVSMNVKEPTSKTDHKYKLVAIKTNSQQESLKMKISRVPTTRPALKDITRPAPKPKISQSKFLTLQIEPVKKRVSPFIKSPASVSQLKKPIDSSLMYCVKPKDPNFLKKFKIFKEKDVVYMDPDPEDYLYLEMMEEFKIMKCLKKRKFYV